MLKYIIFIYPWLILIPDTNVGTWYTLVNPTLTITISLSLWVMFMLYVVSMIIYSLFSIFNS